MKLFEAHTKRYALKYGIRRNMQRPLGYIHRLKRLRDQNTL